MKVTWSVGPVACLLHSLGGWHTQFYMCLLEVLRPVSYNKSVETLCLKWFFSHSVGYGNWELDGEIASDIKTEGNVTTVQCMSTHLTSFAVLVDVAGGLQVCQYVVGVIMISYMLWYHHCCCWCSCRTYLKRNTRPCKLYHTLVVPFLLSVLSSLLCSFYCKGERLEQGMVYTHSLEIKCPVLALIEAFWVLGFLIPLKKSHENILPQEEVTSCSPPVCSPESIHLFTIGLSHIHFWHWEC